MKSLNKRQEYIREYIKDKKKSQIKDILEYVKNNFDVDRRTVIRDINLLLKLGYLVKQGAGRNISYSISERYYLLKEIDVEKYFSIPFDERKIKESFNFDIFNNLKEKIFLKNHFYL